MVDLCIFSCCVVVVVSGEKRRDIVWRGVGLEEVDVAGGRDQKKSILVDCESSGIEGVDDGAVEGLRCHFDLIELNRLFWCMIGCHCFLLTICCMYHFICTTKIDTTIIATSIRQLGYIIVQVSIV